MLYEQEKDKIVEALDSYKRARPLHAPRRARRTHTHVSHTRTHVSRTRTTRACASVACCCASTETADMREPAPGVCRRQAAGWSTRNSSAAAVEVNGIKVNGIVDLRAKFLGKSLNISLIWTETSQICFVLRGQNRRKEKVRRR